MYVPGRYQPCKSSPDAYFSVARMLVDDLHAQAAGRAVWGYPKVGHAPGWRRQQQQAKQRQQLPTCLRVVELQLKTLYAQAHGVCSQHSRKPCGLGDYCLRHRQSLGVCNPGAV